MFTEHTGGQISGTGSFYGLVQFPEPASNPRRVVVDNINVFGEFSWRLTAPNPPTPIPPEPTATPIPGVSLPDWMRGNNGWGSGSNMLPAPTWNDRVPRLPGEQIPPPTAVWIGPCSQGTSNIGIPTTFQQNPCHLRNYVVDNLASYTSEPAQIQLLSSDDRARLSITEIEETAADMFSNWIARLVNLTDANGRTGFANEDWINSDTSDPDSSLAGDERAAWMDCAMIVLFNEHSFWESGTIALPADCSTRFPGLPTP